MNKNLKVLFSLAIVALIVAVAVMSPVRAQAGAQSLIAYGYGESPAAVDPGTQGRNPVYGWTISCEDDDCDVFFTILYGVDPDGTESTTKAENNGSDSVVCYNPGNGGGSLYFAPNWTARLTGKWTQLDTFTDAILGTCANVAGRSGFFFVAFVP